MDGIEVDPNSPNAANEELAHTIFEAIISIKKWLVALTAIIFISMAIMTTNTAITNKAQHQAKEVSAQNQRFLINFSSFMQCLVVSDHNVVESLGVEAYFNECNKLLFKGTGQTPVPVTKVTLPGSPSTTEPSTTTTY